MEPLVSAVITTYRRDEEILKRAIESVLNQTYLNIELIIVDDNGVNSTYHKMVKKLVGNLNQDNMSLIVHEKNKGVQRARNNGLEKAHGEYIAFLDDDDEWLPNKIAKQVEVFQTSTDDNLGLVYCWYNTVTVDSNNRKKLSLITSPKYDNDHVIIELLRKNFIGSTSLPLLKKEYVQEVGGFDESLPSSQDLDLWVRMAQKFKVAVVEEPLLNYYYYSGEKITNNPSSKINGLKMFFEKYQTQIETDTQAVYNYYLKLGSFYNKFGQFVEAKEAFRKSRSLEVSLKDKLISFKGTIRSYVLNIISTF